MKIQKTTIKYVRLFEDVCEGSDNDYEIIRDLVGANILWDQLSDMAFMPSKEFMSQLADEIEYEYNGIEEREAALEIINKLQAFVENTDTDLSNFYISLS